ncbi:128_t:CDS:2, partial [Acaulospora morrowiae]
MAIFGEQENLMVFFGLDGVQRLGIFRWLLITMAILLTVVCLIPYPIQEYIYKDDPLEFFFPVPSRPLSPPIITFYVPSSIFSLAQDHNRNFAFTAVISPDDGQMSPGIVLTPRLTLSGDFVCVVCAWIITLFGSVKLMRRNNCVGQFISAFLILFTLLQTATALYNVLFSNQWIFKIMGSSWQKAYDMDIDLVKEIEYE